MQLLFVTDPDIQYFGGTTLRYLDRVNNDPRRKAHPNPYRYHYTPKPFDH